MENMTQFQTKALIENLIYSLAGFDTSNIYLQHNPPSLAVIGYPTECIQPFGFLIIKIREFASNPQFMYFIEKYLKKLCKLKDRVNTIEELYINLQEDISTFQDLDKIGSSKSLTSISNPESFVLKYFNKKKKNELQDSVNNWINSGDPGDIVEVRKNLGFNMSLWKDMYKLKGIENKDAEELGKIICFIRAVFKKEVVEEKIKIKKCTLFQEDEILNKRKAIENDSEVSSKRKSAENEVVKQDNKNLEFEDPFILKPIKYIIKKQDLKNINDLTVQDIKIKDKSEPLFQDEEAVVDLNKRKFELNARLNMLIYEKLADEFEILYKIIFMQDISFYNTLLHEFYQDFLSSNNSLITKLNSAVSSQNYGLFSCSLSNVSFSEYILKLLKTQTIPQTDSHLILLQRFYISLHPNYLQYFFSQKTFTELKILNRFLFSINSIIFYLERTQMNQFSRICYLIFMRMKNDPIENLLFSRINGSCLKNGQNHIDFCNCYLYDTKFTDINNLVETFQNQINSLLRTYYLTDAEIFYNLAELINLAFEYIQIEYKENVDLNPYNSKVKIIIENLQKSIVKNSGEDDFTEYLKNFDLEKHL